MTNARYPIITIKRYDPVIVAPSCVEPSACLDERPNGCVVYYSDCERELEAFLAWGQKQTVLLTEAVRLLHMLDNQEARHPDVAAFLDSYEEASRG